MTQVQTMDEQDGVTWHHVCTVARVTETDPFAVKIGDRHIAVYLLPDGQMSALDDVCPHEFALLSKGFVEDGEIECPLHQARFEIRTGKCHGPLADRDLRKFPLKIEAGEIYIAI
jgi:NAD(P)H-dependent nitrite reductase small subunit